MEAEETTVTDRGCMYKDDSESICRYLAEIVDNRDKTMTREFKEQNKLIRTHNTEVIRLLTAQGALMREVRIDVNMNVKPAIEKLTKATKNHEIRIWVLEQKALLAFVSIALGIGLGFGLIALLFN